MWTYNKVLLVYKTSLIKWNTQICIYVEWFSKKDAPVDSLVVIPHKDVVGIIMKWQEAIQVHHLFALTSMD